MIEWREWPYDKDAPVKEFGWPPHNVVVKYEADETYEDHGPDGEGPIIDAVHIKRTRYDVLDKKDKVLEESMQDKLLPWRYPIDSELNRWEPLRRLYSSAKSWITSGFGKEFVDDKIWYFDDRGVCVMHPESDLTTDLLDDLLDHAPQLVKHFDGHKVWHDCFAIGRLRRRAEQWLVEWTMSCGKCEDTIQVFTGSGCHHGAFCYVVNEETGEYVTDLRNFSLLCVPCAEKRGKKKSKT